MSFPWYFAPLINLVSKLLANGYPTQMLTPGQVFYRGDVRYCFLPSILYPSTFHTVPVTVCPNILFLRSQTKYSPYLKDFPTNLLIFWKLWHKLILIPITIMFIYSYWLEVMCRMTSYSEWKSSKVIWLNFKEISILIHVIFMTIYTVLASI